MSVLCWLGRHLWQYRYEQAGMVRAKKRCARRACREHRWRRV